LFAHEYWAIRIRALNNARNEAGVWTPVNFLSSLRYRVPLKALEHLICYRKSIDG